MWLGPVAFVAVVSGATLPLLRSFECTDLTAASVLLAVILGGWIGLRLTIRWRRAHKKRRPPDHVPRSGG